MAVETWARIPAATPFFYNLKATKTINQLITGYFRWFFFCSANYNQLNQIKCAPFCILLWCHHYKTITYNLFVLRTVHVKPFGNLINNYGLKFRKLRKFVKGVHGIFWIGKWNYYRSYTIIHSWRDGVKWYDGSLWVGWIIVSVSLSLLGLSNMCYDFLCCQQTLFVSLFVLVSKLKINNTVPFLKAHWWLIWATIV